MTTPADCPYPINSVKGRMWIRAHVEQESWAARFDPNHPGRQASDERMRSVFGRNWHNQADAEIAPPDPADPEYVEYLADEIHRDELHADLEQAVAGDLPRELLGCWVGARGPDLVVPWPTGHAATRPIARSSMSSSGVLKINGKELPVDSFTMHFTPEDLE